MFNIERRKDGEQLAQQNHFMAVDIGSSKVSTVVAQVGTKGNLKILGTGVAPSRGISKGRVAEPVRAQESILTSLKDALRYVGWGSIAGTYVSVSGVGISSANTMYTLVREQSCEELSNGQLKELATSGTPELEHGRQLLHLIPTGYHAEGITFRRNTPVIEGNLPGVVEVETLRILGDSDDLNNIIRTVQGCGISLTCLVSQGLASAEATLTTYEKEQETVLVDIGGGTMDLVIYRHGSPCYNCVIPLGGNQASKDISVLMDLSLDLAEEVKVKWGTVMPELIRPDDEVVVTDYQRNLQRPVNRRALGMLLQARFEEMLKLVMLKVRESGSPLSPVGGLVITGGCANLHGVMELAEKMLRGPIRIARPPEIRALEVNLEKPQYSAAVGLLLWGIRNHGENRTYRKPKKPTSPKRLFWGRKSP